MEDEQSLKITLPGFMALKDVHQKFSERNPFHITGVLYLCYKKNIFFPFPWV